MEYQAIIIWHYYREGKIIDYAVTDFITGSKEDLIDSLKNDEFGKRKNADTKKGDRITILHDVIIL